MNKESNLGFYNKYIFTNSSYLSLHIARNTYRNNPYSKDIDTLIDDALQNNYMNSKLVNIKNKVQNKKIRFIISDNNLITKKDDCINTDNIIMNKYTNTIPINKYTNINQMNKYTNTIPINKYTNINQMNKYTNTIPINKYTNINQMNKYTNTSPILYYRKSPMNKINSNNASLTNRINSY